jgi:serine/threonine protein kinase
MAHDDTSFDAVFCGAIEIASSEARAAFVAQACGSDDGLRRRIERLVDAHFRADSFLESPPPSATLPTDSARSTEVAGTMIGPYKLVQSVGEGGMGTVYMAEQTHPVRRRVALKLIKAGMASRQVLARFGAERQALALMDHPYIAKVFDAGTSDTGRPYFVMELVKGIPITKFCDERRLTVRERIELFVPVCQAVQHAHPKGIIHRDLKPSNILMAVYDGQPVPKIIDFGVAKATGPRLTDQTLYTQFGTIVGTLEHMSPEQAELNQLDIDSGSDISSLGVLLFELLTGSTPLQHKRVGQTAFLEVLRVIREEESPLPSMRLSKTGELQAEIKAQNAALAQLRLTEVAEDKAMHRLFDSWLAQANAGRLSRRVGQRFDSLAAVRKATKLAAVLTLPEERFLELRNAAIACLILPDLRLAKQWPGWPYGSHYVDFDGKLEQYARVDKQGAVSIRRVAGDEEIAHLAGSGSETFTQFSRDGRFLAVYSAIGVSVWKLAQAEPVKVVQQPAGDAYGIAFGPDSGHCAVGHADGSISVYDLASGEPPRRLPSGRRAACLAFHPKDRQIAVSCATSVEIRDLDSGRAVTDLQHQVSTESLAWHPDGKTLAVGSHAMIHLWDVPSGNQTMALEGLRNGGIQIAFNHAGDLLASLGWEGMLRLWDPRTGMQLFSTMPALPCIPRFHPDDRLLAGDARDGRLGLWEVAACREYRTLVRQPVPSRGRGLAGGVQPSGLTRQHREKRADPIKVTCPPGVTWFPGNRGSIRRSTALRREKNRLKPGLVPSSSGRAAY